ncbi:haloacid dehalogenase [Hydrogenimonas thermophila]|uniref:HAD family hydrolase n=1 Tax=Hydrogenimonas thermophila TaxID=223786 RepID=UPI0029373A85|nr:haloacid dehalogenase [Hydrogenimonas thermophila]WOE69204.1 haloacid dehalogenase [Hydrogenimonas thermophila]WOE71714.1 haloacid dehalogenase [Hydrogenimonas thermophila]
MVSIQIPNYGQFNIKHIVCDYNGTIAKDGKLAPGIKDIFKLLSENYNVHVITADTFGTVKKELESVDITVKILSSSNHTQEKGEYIKTLGSKYCASIGNGNNDVEMLQESALSIAIMGDEGCATSTLMKSNIVCKSITDALLLFIKQKRLIATLRS